MLLLAVDSVLQGLASLKGRGLGSGNLDFLVGAGVTAGAGAALADLEGAKADQLDLLALLEGLGDDIDDGGDSGVSVLFRNFSLSGDFGNLFRLIHYETTSKKYSASRGVSKHRKSPENLGESAISPAKSL